MSLKTKSLLLIGLLLLSYTNCSASSYNALINYADGFLAASSDGRIDWISGSGQIIKSENCPGEELNSLLTYNQQVVTAGNKGSILISSNKGTFQKVETGIDQNIFTLALFKDNILAGSEQGILLIGDEKGIFKKMQLPLLGNIVSLSSNFSDCYGVTDKGEIIHSTDGIHWTIFDFNEFYAGYYKTSHFTHILVTDTQIAITGKHEDGSPTLLFSSQGNVWTERSLTYTDEQGAPASLEDTPNNLVYIPSDDLFILCCSRGKLMKIPSCSHCNKLIECSTKDLKGIAYNGNTLMVAGADYFIKAIDTNW